MIRNLLVWAGATALGLGWASTVQAEPLKFDRIPADSKWVAHLDADAARSSKVIAAAIKECLKPLDGNAISEVSHTSPWTAVRFDKLRDVTLYGSRLGFRHGVAIVRGEWDKKDFVQKLQEKMDAKTTTREGHEIYTWTKHKGTDLAHEVALTFPAEGVMVFASGVEELDKALSALAGKGKTLASSESPLTRKVPDGTILFARGGNLKDTDISPELDFFRLIEGFDYSAVESGGKWVEDLNVIAENEQVAAKLLRVMDGVMAKAALCFHEQPKLVRMIESVPVTRTGKCVQLHYEGSVDEVVEVTKPACEALRSEWKSRREMIRSLLGERMGLHQTNQPQK